MEERRVRAVLLLQVVRKAAHMKQLLNKLLCAVLGHRWESYWYGVYTGMSNVDAQLKEGKQCTRCGRVG